MRGRREENVVGRAETEPDRPVEVKAANAPTPARGPAAEPRPPRRPDAGAEVPPNAPLFAGNEADRFRHRWNGIQTSFVDEPRRAVQEADALVAEIMKHLAEMFARERTTLEHQWDRGDSVTTEDLRITLQRYRSFFGRLLAV